MRNAGFFFINCRFPLKGSFPVLGFWVYLRDRGSWKLTGVINMVTILITSYYLKNLGVSSLWVNGGQGRVHLA